MAQGRMQETGNAAFLPFNGKIQDLFDEKERVAFLVGAGISMNPPSSIPSAREIVRELLGLCAPASEIDVLLSLDMLRYELIVEKIKNLVDKDLHFLDYLDLIVEPNAIHHFLAQAVIKRCDNVVTTNFDHMIERALQRQLGAGKENLVEPVITHEDFTKFKRPRDVLRAGKYPVYKIHGAKRNAVTGEATTSSLVTTISSLGKQRVSSETFALESFKKQAMYNVMKNRVLVVAGYSGSDDFDIGPTLRSIPYVRKIIWIDHASRDEPEILVVNKQAKVEAIKGLGRVQAMLVQIGTAIDGDIFLIRGNTTKILDGEIRKAIMPGTEAFPVVASPPSPVLPFKAWMAREFAGKGVPDATRLKVCASIYSDLSEFKAMARVTEQGFKVAMEAMDFPSLSYFGNQGGLVFIAKDEFDLAIEMFQNCITVAQTPLTKAIAMAHLGITIAKKFYVDPAADLEKATTLLVDAMHLFESQHDQWGKILCLNGLGQVDFLKGVVKDGMMMQVMEAYVNIVQSANLEFKAALSNNLGLGFMDGKQVDDARKMLGDSLAIKKQLGDRAGVARVLFNLSVFEHLQDEKDLDKFSARVGEARDLFRAVDQKKDLARMLLMLAYIAEKRKDAPGSQEYLAEATRIVQEVGAGKFPADFREAIDKHDVEGALDIPFYYEIITRDETETDTSGLEWTPSHESVGLFHEAGELMEKGMAAMNSGNLEEAITVFENALAIYKGLHRDDMIGPIESTLLNLKLKTKKIAIEDVIAKKQSEAEALNEELKEFIAEENFGAAAGIMEQLADILDSIGQKDQAKKMRAMAASFSGEPSAETKAESEMEKSDAAMAGEKILDQQNASENFESLFEHEHDDAFFGMLGQIKMAILIQEKKMAMEGIIEGNTLLGGFLAAKGEKKAAIPVLESAIQRAIVIGNEILQAKAEAALGEIYLDLGKAAEALDKYEFALRVFDEKKIEGDVVMALDQVGTIYLNRGEPDLAIERFIEAGQRHKEGDTKNLIFKADALGRLGDIYLRLKDLVKASENLEGSLLAYEKVPNSAIYQAIILLKLSIVDSTMGDIEMAIKDVEDSIDFYKQTPDASMFGTLEKKLGEFKARLANPEQSLQDKMSLAEWRFKQQVYLDARELAGELAGELLGKGREKEALGMLLLHGDAAWLTEQYTAAKESYTKAIDLARKIGDDRLGAAVGVLERLEKDMNQPDVKGNMLYEAALASNDDGDKNEAIDKMFDAADQYQLAGKELDRANSLYKASLWLVDAGRKGEAFECLEESARIREAHGNATAAVDSINAAAAIHEQLGEYSLALDMYRKAKDVLARLTPQNDYGQAVCEERIGSMLVNMQQHEQASKVLQHALIVIEKQGNDRMKAIVHRRLGDALRETDVPAALEHYKIAMTLFDAAKDLEGKACTLNSMAVIHDDRCEYDKALEYYDEAARNSAELGDILGHAAYIYNRAAIELIKRDLAVAERHIIEALEVAQKHNIIPYLAPFYETYGDLERTRGAIGKAIEYYKKSETYFVKLNDPDGLAATLADLARAYISSGNVSDAKLAVDRAREAAKATTKKATAAIVRAIEGELAGARGDLATAIRVCTEARSLLAEAGKKVAEAECLERIADFHVKLKNAVAASDAKKQARAIYASLGLTRRIVN